MALRSPPPNAYLFKPGETFAILQGGMNGTPMPHEEPQELNPPSGVLVYYWLKSAANGPVKLELLDSAGAMRACSASDAQVRAWIPRLSTFRSIWEQPAPPPAPSAGMHRFALGAPSGRGFSGFGSGAAETPAGACASSQPRPRPLPREDALRVDVAAQNACSQATTRLSSQWTGRPILSKSL